MSHRTRTDIIPWDTRVEELPEEAEHQTGHRLSEEDGHHGLEEETEEAEEVDNHPVEPPAIL
jgi:hypothetical protein